MNQGAETMQFRVLLYPRSQVPFNTMTLIRAAITMNRFAITINRAAMIVSRIAILVARNALSQFKCEHEMQILLRTRPVSMGALPKAFVP